MAGQLSRKDAASRRQSGRLDAQLEALKGKLATAEATLAAYRAASEAGRADMLGAEEGDICRPRHPAGGGDGGTRRQGGGARAAEP